MLYSESTPQYTEPQQAELERLYAALDQAGKKLFAVMHEDDETYQAAYAEVKKLRSQIFALETGADDL